LDPGSVREAALDELDQVDRFLRPRDYLGYGKTNCRIVLANC
jgi:hypothetical protein